MFPSKGLIHFGFDAWGSFIDLLFSLVFKYLPGQLKILYITSFFPVILVLSGR